MKYNPLIFFLMLVSSAISTQCTADRTHDVRLICYASGRVDTTSVSLTGDGERFRLKINMSELESYDSLDIRPLFTCARAGDAGYFIFPNGMLCRFPHAQDRRYELSWQPMPISGSLTKDGCHLAIVKGLRFECSLNNELKGDDYSLFYRFRFNEMKPYEDLLIDWYSLTGEDATYSGMGRCYRKYQLERGEVKPLKDRIKANTYLRYAAQAPEIRIRQGWKPVPPTVLEQTPETEPAMKVAVTFDRVKDIIERLKSKGIDKAEICLVGWNARGHDGRWPDVFPVEPSLGGEEKLKELITFAQAEGYQIVGHGNTSDIYRIGSGFDEDLVCKRKDGSLFTTEAWAGGQMYKSCMCEAYERVAQRQNSEAASLGFKGLHYIDVHSNNYPTACHDPKHPHNLKEQAEASLRHMQDAARKMGAVASEGPYDFVASCEDYVLYVTFDLASDRWNPMVDSYIPLWNIVYNGIILNNAGTETVNYTIKEPALSLKAIEFGSRPSFYFYSSFRDDGWHWMGNKDLRCGTEEELTAAVDAISKAWEQLKELGYLQYEFLDEHKALADSVFLSRWSDGSEIVVNYSPVPYLYKGTSVPSMDYRLIK